MNHKIRIAISRVDTQESGTGTSTNAQLEGGEFQFTSKDQVKQYLEDARKTMNEGQIKVLLMSLGVESVDDAMTMVANMTDEEVAAKFSQLALMLKTADQSSTDVNMPMYNIDNMKNQKIELTNADAEKVKQEVEKYIDQQLDQIKTQDGATLRDWVHQEGDIHKVLTSTEFKVKQLGYKLLTGVEGFIKSLNSRDQKSVSEFIKENGTNIRDWFNKTLTVKASTCCKMAPKLASMEAKATFTLKAAESYGRILEALKNPAVQAEVARLLGPQGENLLRNFVFMDSQIRADGFESCLDETSYDALMELFSKLSQQPLGPALQNCKSVLDQLEILIVETLQGEFSWFDNPQGSGDGMGSVDPETAKWNKFVDEHDTNDLLTEDEVGVFDLKDPNELESVEWEAVVGIPGDPKDPSSPDLQPLAEKLDITVQEMIEKANQLKALNRAWDNFSDERDDSSVVDTEDQQVQERLDSFDQQWYQFDQEQVLTDLANALEVFGAEPKTV